MTRCEAFLHVSALAFVAVRAESKAQLGGGRVQVPGSVRPTCFRADECLVMLRSACVRSSPRPEGAAIVEATATAVGMRLRAPEVDPFFCCGCQHEHEHVQLTCHMLMSC